MHRMLLTLARAVPRLATAQAPEPVALTYADGTERTLTDWPFVYHCETLAEVRFVPFTPE